MGIEEIRWHYSHLPSRHSHLDIIDFTVRSSTADWRAQSTTKGEFAFTHNTKEKAIATGTECVGIILVDATDVELRGSIGCVFKILKTSSACLMLVITGP